MLTDFGRYLRKLRIDCGELIKDMAAKLEVTASYLSAVETGKRNIPAGWVQQIADLYGLDEAQHAALGKAAVNSARSVKLELEHLSAERKEAAILFAREFGGLDDAAIDKIREIIKNKGDGV